MTGRRSRCGCLGKGIDRFKKVPNLRRMICHMRRLRHGFESRSHPFDSSYILRIGTRLALSHSEEPSEGGTLEAHGIAPRDARPRKSLVKNSKIAELLSANPESLCHTCPPPLAQSPVDKPKPAIGA